MKPILVVLSLASAIAFQTSPKPPVAVTPEEAPTSPRKGVANELEGVHTSEDGVMSLGKYEGGSVPFKENKITTYVNEKEVVIVQSKQRFAIPVKAITEVLYGNAVHSRVGLDAGIAVPTTATKNQSAGNLTIAGIVWTSNAKKNGVVLRIDKGDYSAFMNALQTVTGLTPASTDGKDR